MSERHRHLLAVVRKLPSDYEPYGAADRDDPAGTGSDCSCGCRHFLELHVRGGTYEQLTQYEGPDLDWGACLIWAARNFAYAIDAIDVDGRRRHSIRPHSRQDCAGATIPTSDGAAPDSEKIAKSARPGSIHCTDIQLSTTATAWYTRRIRVSRGARRRAPRAHDPPGPPKTALSVARGFQPPTSPLPPFLLRFEVSAMAPTTAGSRSIRRGNVVDAAISFTTVLTNTGDRLCIQPPSPHARRESVSCRS